eukprot:m.67937 g.67937  ORF g.67937 m.67937 type:complete len:157 (+) comp8232_c0_seq1:118-588(+)
MTGVALAVEDGVLKEGVFVTVVFFVVYYAMLINQSVTSKILAKKYHKNDKKKFVRYYNADEPEMLRADRVVGNTMEQLGPFVVLYWLSLFIVSAKGGDATYLAKSGWIYILGRVLYFPLFLMSGTKRGIKPLILLATVPCYLVIGYCGYSLVSSVL